MIFLPALAAAASLEPDQVVVLANTAAPGSVEIARHYADVRGIPPGNLIAFAMPTEETVSWPRFVSAVWQPLQETLIRSGWIDVLGRPGPLDSMGRRTYRINGHRVGALVLCRGVPLRVAEDPAVFMPNPPSSALSQFHTNAGSVDGELSLLAWSGGYPINGVVPNPLYLRLQPTAAERLKVVKVTRLDGPTVADALALIDHAVAAERTGLLGRAYVDMGGPYAVGDRWLQTIADLLQAAGFDLDVDREHGTMGPGARFDAPALYFGWYNGTVDGPFLLPGFRFPPGAVAVHIHSFSAASLRSDHDGWTGALVARGVTATVGNVWEPYLEYTHHLDLLVSALLRGANWADATYYALPALSWAQTAIGDPLYRPFAQSWDQQARRFALLPAGLAPYSALRTAHMLDLTGQARGALPTLAEAYRRQDGLVLALALARREAAEGQAEAAVRTLAPALAGPIRAPDGWGLLAESARQMAKWNHPIQAEVAYRRLLAIPDVPIAARARWLVDALDAAKTAKDGGQTAAWTRDLDSAVAQLRSS